MSSAESSFPLRLNYAQIGLAVLIVLLAFALRTGVIFQRAAADPEFIPIEGTDQGTHLDQARGLLDGTWPDAPYVYQPAPPYVYAFGLLLYGDSLIMIQLLVALVSSLAVGWMVGAGWLLTKRAWGGYLAGGLYGFSATGVFYGASLSIAPQAVFWMSLLIFLSLWQREKTSWVRTILLGMAGGFMGLSRVNLLPLMGLVALWYLFALRIPWRQRFAQLVLLTLASVLVVGQATWHNYRTSGELIPVVDMGAKELYLANNRDSGGGFSPNLAYANLDMSYTEALQRDIQVAPEHFFGLIGFKFAHFWNWQEVSNNVNFSGAEFASPLLRILPFNFSVFAVLGIIGLGSLWRRDRLVALFLGGFILWMIFTYLLVFIHGRLRHPTEVALILLTSVALLDFADTIRHRNWQDWLRRIGFPAAIALGLIVFSTWALYPTRLPAKRTYTELPADAITVNANFGDVTFVGWRPISAWPAAEEGWVAVYEAVGVELFWKINEPTETVYNFFYAYVDEGQRYDGIDYPLGAVSFPQRTTDEWQPGTIYGEIINLQLGDEIPQGRSGQIRVGVWYRDFQGQLVNVPTDDGRSNILLQTMAIFNPYVPSTAPELPALPAGEAIFGEQIVLEGAQLPTT
ncbi:MAG: hypothetical protein KC496_22045, partial [Anaerolineae bacterium]|nr:hypothetical protein [Anaerolineae bacterium]